MMPSWFSPRRVSMFDLIISACEIMHRYLRQQQQE
jgi:hypothetical protein